MKRKERFALLSFFENLIDNRHIYMSFLRLTSTRRPDDSRVDFAKTGDFSALVL